MTAPVKIPAELFALAESSHFDGELDLPALEVGPDDYALLGPVSWGIDVTNTGAAFLVSGRAQASGVCACSRCLDDVSYEFDGVIEGYFLINGHDASDYVGPDEEEPGADEFDVLPDDHVVDVQPLIEAALRVDAPQMPLCKQDCAGLCPICGANLNEGSCGCAEDSALADFDCASNPFSVLSNLKFD